jgi:hypothetical protein
MIPPCRGFCYNKRAVQAYQAIPTTNLAMPTPPPPTRSCGTCGRALPLDQFRVRTSTGKPRDPCRQCWAEYMRGHRVKERDRAIDRFLVGLAHENYRRGATRRLTAAALRQFGTLERLARALRDYFDRQRDPARRWRVLRAVLWLSD